MAASRKSFFALIMVIVGSTIIYSGVSSVRNAFTFNYIAFNKGAQGTLDITRQTRVRAQLFSEKEALSKLEKNPLNGRYFRFDDHFDKAKASGCLDCVKTDTDVQFQYTEDFDDQSNLTLRPINRQFTINEGVLKFIYQPNNNADLINVKPLHIGPGEIDEIEIRLKVNYTKEIQILWEDDAIAQKVDSSWFERALINTIPDSQFHTYTLNIQTLMKMFFIDYQAIQTIVLRFPGTEYDEIEIDYIRLKSRSTDYDHKPADVRHEEMNNELRKTIYMHTDMALTYAVQIPPEQPRMRFGCSILRNDSPVKFLLEIKPENEKKKIIFAETISRSENWHDYEIDLKPYAGQDADLAFIAQGNENIAFWSNPVLYGQPNQRLNIVIVLEDALRADHLSCYGYDKTITPVKDALSKQGVLFLNAYSQATYTRASCASFMTSLLPTATGVVGKTDVLPSSYLTLAEILRHQGFTTASFIQNPHAGPTVGLHQGFSYVVDSDALGMGSAGIYMAKELDHWLGENSDKNFFLYLHTIDPHGPYDPPDYYVKDYKEKIMALEGQAVQKSKEYDPEWIAAPTAESRNILYNLEVAHNDLCFQRFIDKIEELGIRDDTIIIFIADHGEFLGEHEIWGHEPPGYHQVLHVPMIIAGPPEICNPGKIREPVQLLDIMPTILDWTGIDTNAFLMQGQSLKPLLKKEETTYFTRRLCLSEEVLHTHRSETKGDGSIFYQNWHVLNSSRINDGVSRKLGIIHSTLPDLFKRRVFNFVQDTSETFSEPWFLFDVYFHYKINRFMQKLKKYNLEIQKIMSPKQEQAPPIDSQAIDKLRGLGYLQ